MKNLMGIVLTALLLVSCSHVPFANKNGTADSQKTAKTATVQKQQEAEPKPGDVRVTDGVEYIYAKNRRYMSQPYEPEYVWMRKDQYSPGLFESLRARAPGPTKEEKEMEGRIAKLEEELKKKGTLPQMPPLQPISAASPQPVSATPVAMASKASLPAPAFNYPSPRMKRHVLVLRITGTTDPKSEQLAERVTGRLITTLESTGRIICLDPGTVGFRDDIAQSEAMKNLDELHGIQAVVKGTLTSNTKISLTVYNAETGLILRQLNGDAALLTGQHETSPRMESMKAMGIEVLTEEVLKSILSLDWHTRVASTEQGKIFINAGRLSGLEKGDTLEVYSPGEQIIDAATKVPLGKVKGEYRGEVEVAELFGVDAAWARARKGDGFSPTDLVYLKR
jgi:hypothetical protein